MKTSDSRRPRRKAADTRQAAVNGAQPTMLLSYRGNLIRVGNVLVIGRSVECGIVLADFGVSREHARVKSDGATLILEDLGSSNGTQLNGRTVRGSRRLVVGDRIRIATHELEVVEAPGATATPASAGVYRVTGADADPTRTTVQRPALRLAPARASKRPPKAPRTMLTVALTLAEGALDRGAWDDAEAAASTELARLSEEAARKPPPPLAVVERAARVAARLATETGRCAWAEYVIGIYRALASLMPAAVTGELAKGAPKLDSIDLDGLRAYTAQMRARAPKLGDAERAELESLLELERALRRARRR